MKRQTAINEKLMLLQRREMTAIREWMTNTEDKISRCALQSNNKSLTPYTVALVLFKDGW